MQDSNITPSQRREERAKAHQSSKSMFESSEYPEIPDEFSCRPMSTKTAQEPTYEENYQSESYSNGPQARTPYNFERKSKRK